MPVDNIQLSVEDVFARIREQLPSYEHRPQQLELALAIQRTFARKETGVFEAGTGTGKSLAALIPAILSGKRAVVSTATIALQEQYINKDIPALAAVLPFAVQSALMKGRGNYLGLRRWSDHVLEQEVDNRLVDWVGTTEFGDISELDFMPASDTWREVNSDADDCLRHKCPTFSQCFYFEARKKAEKAQILVVNHALLLADAASFGSIMPAYELLIIDEAQHLPDVASDAFSSSIGNRGLRILCSRASKKLSAPPHIVHDIEMEAAEFFQRLAFTYTALKTRIRNRIEGTEGLRDSLMMLKSWLEEETFEHILDIDMAREKAKLKAKALLTTTTGYLHCLQLLENPDPNWVMWIERGDATGSRIEVVAAPLDVSPFLQDLLLDKPGLESSVWMSATLATGGEDPFSYFKRQVGIEGHVIQSLISSPFDYKRQALLYLPRSLPNPNAKEYALQSCQEIETLIRIARGRTFALFTSYQAMNTAFELLSQRLPYESCRQGDMPRKRLIEWFLSTPNAVLFGTASFWEGVSIDGDQLSCVIIDRIPFQSPDDPIYEAKCEAIQESGEGNWFRDLALPHAIMRLKQGVGRLIRTHSDRGIVAILDPRLTGKTYGHTVLSSLPPMTVIKSLNGIRFIEDTLDTLT